jgi:hypothetical protein
MSRKKKNLSFVSSERAQGEEDGNALLPVMSLMLILIPLLIGKVAFTQFRLIEARTPGMSQNDEPVDLNDPEKKSTRNVIVNFSIKQNELNLDLVDEDTGDTITNKNLKVSENKTKSKEMMTWLMGTKNEYKKLNTLMVSVDPNVVYSQMSQIFSDIREPKGKPEAPNKPPKSLFTVVVLPEGSI